MPPKVVRNLKAEQEAKRLEEEAERQRQAEAQGNAAHLLQRFYRGMRVRRAFRHLVALEELVLEQPTHGPQAVERLLPTPRAPSAEEAPVASWDHGSPARPHKLSQLLEEANEDEDGLAAAAIRRRRPSVIDRMPPAGLMRSRRPSVALPSAGGRRPSIKMERPIPELSMGEGQGFRRRPSVAGSQAAMNSHRAKQSRKDRFSTGGSIGSQASRTSSQTRAASRPPDPMIDVEALTHQFEKVPTISIARKMAEDIMWLLRSQALKVGDFERIREHHRLRRRNIRARVRLRLVLVQHGTARDGVGGGRSMLAAHARDGGGASPTTEAGAALDSSPRMPPSLPVSPTSASKELTPEGWAQVTRTAWAMRLCPKEFSPRIVLVGSGKCCSQTAERLRALADDPDFAEAAAEQGDGDVTTIASTCGEDFHQRRDGPRQPHPEAVVCSELDFPLMAAAGIVSPVVYTLTQVVAKAVDAAISEEEEMVLDAPPPVLLVTGGASLEALLACLNAGLSEEERPLGMASGRLSGGDAVLLESPIMYRIVGLTEDEERLRPSGELWDEALRKGKWIVKRHITGDGRKPWGIPKQPEPVVADNLIASIAESRPADSFSETRREWNRYVGEPLVLSQGDFMELCERAGSIYRAFDKVTLERIRPLVNESYTPWQTKKPSSAKSPTKPSKQS